MASQLSPRPALISDALAAAILPRREKRAREILAGFPSRAVQWANRHWDSLTVPTTKPTIANKVIAWLSVPPLLDDQDVIDQLRSWHFDLQWDGEEAEIVALPKTPLAQKAALEAAAAGALEIARLEADAEARQQIGRVAQKYPVTKELKTDAEPEQVAKWAKEQVTECKQLTRALGATAAVKWGCGTLGATVAELPGVRSTLKAAKAPASMAPLVAWDRMLDESWWKKAARKQLRKGRGWAWATLAPLAIKEGASSEALEDSQRQDAAGEAWAQEWQAVDDAGNTVDMTGPEQARKRQYAEILATACGIGELADISGEIPYFVTVTCPERMHPTTTHGGPRRINPDYDGTSTEEALSWLRGGWAKARAAMGRAGIGKHWVRALEPHEDGTPHFHIIAWIGPKRERELEDIIRRYFEAGQGTGSARQKHGIQIKKVENGTQGAIAYLAMYIGKGTSGIAGEERTAERYRAWRRTYGARAFAFSHRKATLWRMLRKVRAEQGDAAYLAQEAAKAGEFALFWAEADAAGLALWKETETGEDIGGGYRVERQRVRGVVDKAGQVYLAKRYRLEPKPKPEDLTNANDSHLRVQLLSKNQGADSRTREHVQELKKGVIPAPAKKLREVLHHTASPRPPFLEKIRQQKSRKQRRGGERARALRERLRELEEARGQEAAHALGWMLWLEIYIWNLDPSF